MAPRTYGGYASRRRRREKWAARYERQQRYYDDDVITLIPLLLAVPLLLVVGALLAVLSLLGAGPVGWLILLVVVVVGAVVTPIVRSRRKGARRRQGERERANRIAEAAHRHEQEMARQEGVQAAARAMRDKALDDAYYETMARSDEKTSRRRSKRAPTFDGALAPISRGADRPRTLSLEGLLGIPLVRPCSTARSVALAPRRANRAPVIGRSSMRAAPPTSRPDEQEIAEGGSHVLA